MLFDLRAPGRRRTIKVFYVWLALLMAGGLIFFGIGGATSGGLLDAFQGGGGGSGGGALTKRAQQAQRRVNRNPSDPAAWANLAHQRYLLAGAEGYNNSQQGYTAKGLSDLRQAGAAWERYLALDPPKPDADLANLMSRTYAILNQAGPAEKAQRIYTAARPSANAYYQLAVFAYRAGDTSTADLASRKAVALAPKAQKTAYRQQLKTLRQQATTGAGTATPTTTSGG